MAEGYLTAAGEWIAGEQSDASYQGENRSVILSTDEEFAEVVVRRRAPVAMNALSMTPIMVDHLPSGATVADVLLRASDGAASFFEDLIWYGYGLVAYTGALGDTQEADVKDTMAAVERALGDVISNNRVCFAASLYVNYTINHGLPEFLGRSLTSIVTQSQLQIATGVAAPVLWKVHSVAIFFASTFGSFLRLGDTMRESFGDLSSLTAFDLLLVSLNGTDDPNVLRQSQANMKEALVETLSDIADSLDDASDPPRFIANSIFDTNSVARMDIQRYAVRMRVLAERLAAMPVTNLLESQEFFNIMDAALVEAERLQRSHLWEHLPWGAQASIVYFDQLYNPAVCNVLKIVFEYLYGAAKSGSVMTIPTHVLEYLATQINWGASR